MTRIEEPRGPASAAEPLGFAGFGSTDAESATCNCVAGARPLAARALFVTAGYDALGFRSAPIPGVGQGAVEGRSDAFSYTNRPSTGGFTRGWWGPQAPRGAALPTVPIVLAGLLYDTAHGVATGAQLAVGLGIHRADARHEHHFCCAGGLRPVITWQELLTMASTQAACMRASSAGWSSCGVPSAALPQAHSSTSRPSAPRCQAALSAYCSGDGVGGAGFITRVRSMPAPRRGKTARPRA